VNRPAKVIASALGLTAFAIATIAGMAVGNPTDTILWHAIIAMIVCQMVGLVLGSIGERVVTDAIADYQQRNQIPKLDREVIMAEPVEVVDEAPSDRRAA
jgi:hypothetical protein